MIAAFAWTLIHFVWEGAAIALAVWVALALSRGASSRTRYALACMGMLAMLAAFVITLIRFWPARVILAQGAHVSFAVPPVPFWLGQANPAPPPDRLGWLVPAWILGVCVFSMRTLLSWIAAQRLRRLGVCTAPGSWVSKLGDLAARIRLTRPVALLESCLVDIPVVIGFLRPVILLPAGLLTGLPPEQIESILLHELAHIRRLDYLVNLLQSLAEDLLFYHPAVWWISGVIRAERENCCDDVAGSAASARDLAAALIALEQKRAQLREPAVAANGGRLMERIQRLLSGTQPRSVSIAPVLLLGVLIACAAVAAQAARTPAPAAPEPVAPLAIPAAAPKPAPVRPAPRPLAQAVIAQAAPAPAAPQAAASLPDSYERWLNEEAVYIITPEERSAFLKLQTDAERTKFIQQFWARRDPTPGTARNEFQEEHYRRIAFANNHFAAPGIAGWRTDRGRYYIMFGPPDQIETGQTLSNGTQAPSQLWHYRYLEGRGDNINLEFVDQTSSGDYRLIGEQGSRDSPERDIQAELAKMEAMLAQTQATQTAARAEQQARDKEAEDLQRQIEELKMQLQQRLDELQRTR